MARSLDKVEGLYDSIAQEYAARFSGEHESKPKDREMLQRFARQIGRRGPVWDIGCGPGQTARFLKNLGVEISGLDLSEKMLAQARASNPGIRFQKENILALGFADCSLAGTVAFYAMVHFTAEQVDMALREVFRVLQPGGIFLFTFHVGEGAIHLEEFLGKKVDIDFMFFTANFISNCLKDCGFEKIEIIEREPYPGLEYQSRRAYAFAIKPAERISS